MKTEWTYVVIGGGGFLGGHIWRLLFERVQRAKEIRIFDLVQPVIPQQYQTRVTFYHGDVRDYTALLRVCENADAVIHSASLIDVWYKYSSTDIYQVNVSGTENVVNACLRRNVCALVYTGSAESVGLNGNSVENVDEKTRYGNTKRTLPYLRSKFEAEARVLFADGMNTQNGSRLKTCVLRPTGVYGERDTLLPWFYAKGRSDDNVVYEVAPEGTLQTRVYAGNVAWMHIMAVRALKLFPRNVAGRWFFCYDATPVMSYDDFNMLFLTEGGLCKRRISYGLVRCLACVNDAARMLANCCGKTFAPLLNSHTLKMACTTFTIDTDAAHRAFQYQPLFTWSQCYDRTLSWLQTDVFVD